MTVCFATLTYESMDAREETSQDHHTTRGLMASAVISSETLPSSGHSRPR